ncbi:uncharacterized protein [Temnothorax longispinosus]|uniref:uncharacterized protein n=1 Tax=Temnothorax longispinosus TaxID=300112 RepID=UPI003A99167E
MDNNKLEQLANIKFYVKLEKTFEKTYEDLNEVYGRNCLNRPRVEKWYKRFLSEKFDFASYLKEKRERDEGDVLGVSNIIFRSDRRASLSVIKDLWYNLSKIAIHRILTEDLHMCNVCERFVPCTLTEDEKDARVEYCRDMLKAAEDSDSKKIDFKKNIVTCGEKWLYQDEVIPEQKDAKPKTEPKYQTVKYLLTVFFDTEGIVRAEILPERVTLNPDYYFGILNRLWNTIHHDDIRPEYQNPGSWYLLHDYSPEHKSKNVRSFLAEKGIRALDIPPYSPDLTPFDFWFRPKLFRSIKKLQNRIPFNIPDDVLRALEAMKDKKYNSCFKKMFKRLGRCIESKETYLESNESNTMDNKTQQRANIKFCAKLKIPAGETVKMLSKVYSHQDCFKDTNIYNYYDKFRNKGREDISDGHSIPRKSISRSEKEKMVLEIFRSDRYMQSVTLIAKLTDITRQTVHSILDKDLRKCKIDNRFVPRTLRDDQKDAREKHCKDMLKAANTDPNFMKNIVTCGKTWFFQYEPVPEQQNRKGTKSKNVRMQKGPIKTLLTVFFDSKGIVHKEFMPEDQTADAAYYLKVLNRLWRKISEIPEYQEQGSWFLLHDYAPEHKSKIVCDFLATNHITTLEHPPHSPDLTPYDFWLFPKLKSAIEGKRYNNIPDMEQALTVALEAIKKKEYKDCFEKLFNQRLQRCIDSEGMHIKLKK